MKTVAIVAVGLVVVYLVMKPQVAAPSASAVAVAQGAGLIGGLATWWDKNYQLD